MNMSEEKLRGQLTLAMAQAVDETDTFEDYFGEPTESMDYGAARADGSLPTNMLFLWEFAGYISDYVSAHGIDVLDMVENVSSLFLAYQAVKGPPNDFDDAEKQKIQDAVTDVLKDLTDKKS